MAEQVCFRCGLPLSPDEGVRQIGRDATGREVVIRWHQDAARQCWQRFVVEAVNQAHEETLAPRMTVTDALLLASKAHRDQVDKLGEPYFEHVFRVFSCVEGRGHGGSYLITAALHDVVEDTDWTLTRLSEVSVPLDALQALAALSRRGGEVYQDYIARVAQNPIARIVKLCDLKDNLDPERLDRLPGQTRERLRRKYEMALEVLGASTTV